MGDPIRAGEWLALLFSDTRTYVPHAPDCEAPRVVAKPRPGGGWAHVCPSCRRHAATDLDPIPTPTDKEKP